jgi:transposase
MLAIQPGRGRGQPEGAAKGSKPENIGHACMDMSAAYLKGVTASLPKAQISYDRFHVIALANAAMDEVRRQEMRTDAAAVNRELGTTNRKVLKSLMWGMRKNPSGWSDKQTDAMHWLQRSNLRSARAWRLKQALREVYGKRSANDTLAPIEPPC